MFAPRVGGVQGERPAWPYVVNTDSWQANGLTHWYTFESDTGWIGPNLAKNDENNYYTLPASYNSVRLLTVGYCAYNTAGDFEVQQTDYPAGTVPMTMAVRSWYTATNTNSVLFRVCDSTQGYYHAILPRSTGSLRATQTLGTSNFATTGNSVIPTYCWNWTVAQFDGLSWRKIHLAYAGFYTSGVSTATNTDNSAVFDRIYFYPQTTNTIGEFRLYNRILSDIEIQALPQEWTGLYYKPNKRVFLGEVSAPTGVPWAWWDHQQRMRRQ